MRTSSLDPQRDHAHIVHLLACYEFPFDMTRSLEFALFRTFCAPRIGALLDGTREFVQRAQKRYDDTDLLISTLIEYGYDSAPGCAALARINAIHGHFKISNEDFLYVLSTFMYEPIRWIDRFGWRRLQAEERLALFYFWREVGARMGIQSLPEDYESFERFNREYETRHFRYTDAARRVGSATREMFVRWFPRPLRAFARWGIHALLDEELIRAFGFPRPAPLPRRLVAALLRWRSRLARLVVRRRQPRLRTALRHRSYPDGYTLEQLWPSYLAPREKS